MFNLQLLEAGFWTIHCGQGYMVQQKQNRSLTVVLADVLSKKAGGAESDDLIVLVEFTEGHAQAVIRKDQEYFIQDIGEVLQIQLWNTRTRDV